MILARHPQRPRTLDFLAAFSDTFVELHGDRQYRDDQAIVGGLLDFNGRTVMVIGHQKGRSTRENLDRNFGMVRPEGYRKALRLMDHAARFNLPLVTFIDTPGADPGPTSEEHGQAFIIAECLYKLADLPVPVISVVIGEGGSGGALAIGAADRILMLENAIYSVASPEASATILWRDATKAPTAAAAMRITAPDLLELGIIDEVIPEQSAAHEDPASIIAAAEQTLTRNLAELDRVRERGVDQLLDQRAARYRQIGQWEEATLASTSTGR